jgi:hypothetical protein
MFGIKALAPLALPLLMAGCAAGALAGCATGAFAAPGEVRTVNGVSYYDVDPGPIDPGTFWTSGQYKYDPDAYMDRTRWDTAAKVMTVFASHAGRANCVFRKRVVIDDWDFRHPYLRVCRKPE